MNETEKTRGFVFKCRNKEDVEKVRDDIYNPEGSDEKYEFYIDGNDEEVRGMELPRYLEPVKEPGNTSFTDVVFLPAGTVIHRDIRQLFRLKRYKDSGYLLWEKDGAPSGDVMIFDMMRWDGEALNYLDQFTPNMPATDGIEYTNCSGAPVFVIPSEIKETEEPTAEEPEAEEPEAEEPEVGEPEVEEPEVGEPEVEEVVEPEEVEDEKWSGSVRIKDGKRSVHADLMPGGEIDYYGQRPGLADRWHGGDDELTLKSDGKVLARLYRVENYKWEGRNSANRRVSVSYL